jgi:ubiquinone/menaquinone biosynthesis C-methylase UbiE
MDKHMSEPVRFNDGAGYERMMGVWSRIAGRAFLDWLKPSPNLAWVDVGCGNGAFTELIVETCRPAAVHGIDPSEGQLAFARTRPGARLAQFRQGDAMSLPFESGSFDIATMALVIFFVPEPEKGVAEMTRVVKPGGTVAAYAWDIEGGGFPHEPAFIELRAMGITPPGAPHPEAANLDVLPRLWREAGLREVETRVITVTRTHDTFDDLWDALQGSPSIKGATSAMPQAQLQELKDRLRKRVPAGSDGRITLSGVANAVKGRVA